MFHATLSELDAQKSVALGEDYLNRRSVRFMPMAPLSEIRDSVESSLGRELPIFKGGGGTWEGLEQEPSAPAEGMLRQNHPIAPEREPGLTRLDLQVIYQIPEMLPGNPLFDATAFCYSAMEHVEWMTSNSMVVTYSCDSRVFTDVVNNMELYRPVPVTIPLQ
jgi:hypothetical protein